MRTLIIDHHDSFTWNLFQAVAELDAPPAVARYDAIDLAGVERLAPERVILSPGPGRPDAPGWFGVSADVILTLEVPILGVCLGHQGIIHTFGGRIVRAPEPRHGKTSAIHHRGTGLFEGLPEPFTAMRYHSLVGERSSIPPCLEITAWTDDGVVMGVSHVARPIHGVQFHPESIGTPEGRRILARFLRGRG